MRRERSVGIMAAALAVVMVGVPGALLADADGQAAQIASEPVAKPVPRVAERVKAAEDDDESAEVTVRYWGSSEAVDALSEAIVGFAPTADEFAARHEPREVEAFVMTAPRGPGVSLRRPSRSSPGIGSSTDGLLMMMRRSSIDSLAGSLEERLGRPIVDETGLTGSYAYDLQWEPGDRESLLRAAEEQLGLRLTPARRTVKMLVVSKAPSPAQ